MFYEIGTHRQHGFRHDPFKAFVSPRPIGWISTVNEQGVNNLAPYSFFNATSYNPPTVMFSSGKGQVEDDGRKDSLRNIIETGEFVHNFTNWDTRVAMNESSTTTAMATERSLQGTVTTSTPTRHSLLKILTVTDSVSTMWTATECRA